MLYIYGTCYNNAIRIRKSILSLNKIEMEKKFLIVDNYSNDGTYEELTRLKLELNIEVSRRHCSRGLGRQLAMNMAFESSRKNDIFMYFDSDTDYTEEFCEFVKQIISEKLTNGRVFVQGICSKEVNFKVPWRNLNSHEDVERYSRFLKEGYKIIRLTPHDRLSIIHNEYIINTDREKRYAKSFNYFSRSIRNIVDALMAEGISKIGDLRQFTKYFNFKRRFSPVLLVSFLIMKVIGITYRYDSEINWVFLNKNSFYITLNDLSINNNYSENYLDPRVWYGQNHP